MPSRRKFGSRHVQDATDEDRARPEGRSEGLFPRRIELTARPERRSIHREHLSGPRVFPR
jgi:hypothetical protein